MSAELKKQLRKILLVVFALSAAQLAIFFVLSQIKPINFLPAFFGTVLGFAIASLNMYFLARSVSSAVEKNAKGAQASMGTSYMLRLAAIAVAVFAAIKLPAFFNIWAVVIPILFPRIAIMLLNFNNKKEVDTNGT